MTSLTVALDSIHAVTDLGAMDELVCHEVRAVYAVQHLHAHRCGHAVLEQLFDGEWILCVLEQWYEKVSKYI